MYSYRLIPIIIFFFKKALFLKLIKNSNPNNEFHTRNMKSFSISVMIYMYSKYKITVTKAAKLYTNTAYSFTFEKNDNFEYALIF